MLLFLPSLIVRSWESIWWMQRSICIQNLCVITTENYPFLHIVNMLFFCETKQKLSCMPFHVLRPKHNIETIFQLMGLLPRITQTRLLFLMMLVCNAHVDLCSSVCLWVCVCTRSCSSTIWILKCRAIISSDVFIFFAFFILHCTSLCYERNKNGERTIVTLFSLMIVFSQCTICWC